MIKEKIKNLRASLKLTQADFANAIGVSKASVGAYENGKAKPSEKVIDRICETFKIDRETLTGAKKAAGEAAIKGREKVKSTARKTTTKAKQAAEKTKDVMEPVIEAAAPVIEKVEKAVEPVVEVVIKKENVQISEADVVIESTMGGQISVREILTRVLSDAWDSDNIKIYVKAEENRAYYTTDKGEGSIELW